MKSNYIKLVMLAAVSLSVVSCDNDDTDFGFDSSLKGVVQDGSSAKLYGDPSSNNLVVKSLGVGDEQALEIRVNGEGSYQNLKMFPKKYKVWLEGPIVKSDTVSIDLSAEPNYDLPFTVTPLTSPKIISGSANGTSITVDYDIMENQGNTVKKMEIYCSTVKYPSAATGSRTNVYFTKIVGLSVLSGNVIIDGLEKGVEYYLRIGAQADGAAVFNYSNQVMVTTN